jgi:uncharacterized protein (DUF2141 family)
VTPVLVVTTFFTLAGAQSLQTYVLTAETGVLATFNRGAGAAHAALAFDLAGLTAGKYSVTVQGTDSNGKLTTHGVAKVEIR